MDRPYIDLRTASQAKKNHVRNFMDAMETLIPRRQYPPVFNSTENAHSTKADPSINDVYHAMYKLIPRGQYKPKVKVSVREGHVNHYKVVQTGPNKFKIKISLSKEGNPRRQVDPRVYKALYKLIPNKKSMTKDDVVNSDKKLYTGDEILKSVYEKLPVRQADKMSFLLRNVFRY